jgi:hypothetical protein
VRKTETVPSTDCEALKQNLLDKERTLACMTSERKADPNLRLSDTSDSSALWPLSVFVSSHEQSFGPGCLS